MPRPLAQAASDRQPAAVESANPNDWFDVPSARMLSHLAENHERLWLLENTSPFMSWSFRALERHFALRHYPLRVLALATADDSVRLLEVSTLHAAPNPLSAYSGDVATDLRFGEDVRLLAFDLPGGNVYRAGDVVEISLLWTAESRPERDYTVAWFVVETNAGHIVAQGMDSAPQSGFAPTTEWRTGERVWDNRALRLPHDLSPGGYKIWVALYFYDSEVAEIRRLAVTGGEAAEAGTVAVLPAMLTVE